VQHHATDQSGLRDEELLADRANGSKAAPDAKGHGATADQWAVETAMIAQGFGHPTSGRFNAPQESDAPSIDQIGGQIFATPDHESPSPRQIHQQNT
jgi:hypothetical protein